MEYTIRAATLTDIPAIAEVARHTWEATYAHTIAAHNRAQFLRRAYSHQALRAAIGQKPHWFFVALQGETVVGFAHYLRRFDADGELVRIYIHPSHQRRGLGRALLAMGLQAMAAEGVGQCYVSVGVENTGARAFYERFGFRPNREYARFLGDQLLRLVEYVAPVADLLRAASLPSPGVSAGHNTL